MLSLYASIFYFYSRWQFVVVLFALFRSIESDFLFKFSEHESYLLLILCFGCQVGVKILFFKILIAIFEITDPDQTQILDGDLCGYSSLRPQEWIGKTFLKTNVLRILFISVFFHSAVAVVVRGFPSRMNFASQTKHTKFLLSYLRVQNLQQNLTPKMNQLGGIGDCN